MYVEKVNLLSGSAHVRVKLQIFQQCARSTFLHADDDRPWKALGGTGLKMVPRVAGRRHPAGPTPVDG